MKLPWYYQWYLPEQKGAIDTSWFCSLQLKLVQKFCSCSFRNVHREDWGCSTTSRVKFFYDGEKRGEFFSTLCCGDWLASSLRGPIFKPEAIFEGSLSHTLITLSRVNFELRSQTLFTWFSHGALMMIIDHSRFLWYLYLEFDTKETERLDLLWAFTVLRVSTLRFVYKIVDTIFRQIN